MNVYEVDQALMAHLRGIEGLEVVEDAVPGGAKSRDVYAVFFGGDLTPRAKAVSMASPRYSAMMHTFAVMVAARTATVRNSVREEVRSRLVGWSAQPSSNRTLMPSISIISRMGGSSAIPAWI